MTFYELRISGGLILRFDTLGITTLDIYNQTVHDNPDELVELVEISYHVVRSSDNIEKTNRFKTKV